MQTLEPVARLVITFHGFRCRVPPVQQQGRVAEPIAAQQSGADSQAGRVRHRREGWRHTAFHPTCGCACPDCRGDWPLPDRGAAAAIETGAVSCWYRPARLWEVSRGCDARWKETHRATSSRELTAAKAEARRQDRWQIFEAMNRQIDPAVQQCIFNLFREKPLTANLT